MAIKTFISKTWAVIRRILWYKSILVRVILVLILLLILALQSTYIQTYLAQIASEKISAILKFPISIKQLEIQWLDQVKLKEVQVKDRKNNNMIYVQELTLNYGFMSLFKNGNIYVDDALLDSLNVNLVDYPDSLGGLNIEEFISAIDDSPADTSKKISAGNQFVVHKILLRRSFFSFTKPLADSLKDNTFDYNHFAFNNLNADITNFLLVSDTVQLDIKNLRGIEPSIKFPVKEISTSFRYFKKGIHFQGLTGRLGNSFLTDTLMFSFKKPAEMGDFNEKVKIHAHLQSSIIHFSDLAIFAPSLKKYPEVLNISGKIDGKVSKFKIDSLDLRFGKNSRLIGRLAMDGLPNFDETFIDFNLKKSYVNTKDLRIYLGTSDVFRRINKFGFVKFNSEFSGFIYDFVTHGKFETALGYINADVNFKTDKNYYKGALITKHFNIGKFLEEENLLQLVDLQGNIEGNNFTTETAHFKIKADVSRLGFKFYDYHNIKVNADLEHKFFKGSLAVKDANLVLDGVGEINLNDSTFKLKGTLDSVLLHKINLSKDSITLKGKLDLDFVGLDLDKLEGVIDIRDAYLGYKKQDLPIKHLFIHSKKLPNKTRDFDIESDYIDFKADGRFDFKQVYQDLKSMVEEYTLHFENNQKKLNDYYIAKPILSTKQYNLLAYQVRYDINLKDITPVVRLFVKDFYVSPETTFKGLFVSDYKKHFSMSGQIDSLFYTDMRFYHTSLNLSTYKEEDNREVALSFEVTSEKQRISGFNTEFLHLNAEWINHKINFDSFVKRQNSQDKLNTTGSFEFVGNRQYDLVINPSEIVFLDEKWTNPDTLHIGIDGQNIDFHTVRFINGNKKVLAIGQISEDITKTLQLQLVDFNLDMFSTFMGKKLAGSLNGEAILRNIYHTPQVETDVSASNIYMDSIYYGDLYASSQWDNQLQKLKIKAKLKYNLDSSQTTSQLPAFAKRKLHLDENGNDTIPLLDLEGYYYAQNKISPLELTAKLRELPINLIEPFLSSFASDFEGLATGDIVITRKIAQPLLKGRIFVDDGRFKVNYLNTYYHFSDFIYLEHDHIGMKQLKLLDENSNRAIVNGGIYHDSFQKYLMQLHLDFRKFKILNTEISDEALYFGTAYGTGTMDILGATSNLQIDINAKTERGTKIYLALDGYAGVEEKAFIKFIDFKNDSVVIQKKDKVDLSGLKMNFNLELTPDAYGEIIFDKQSGDIISGNTLGKLNMAIDTKGGFTMFGDVEFVKGSYTFTFLNVVSKEFDIKAGSRVSWSGDPLAGQLNVEAIYKTRTSLLPIMTGLDSAARQSAELRRPYPVRVDLLVSGALMSPEIKFGIDISEYPSVISAGSTTIPMETHVQAFKARLASNEQELSRQVFSLMVLNRLSETDAFASLSGQSLTSSVSELLTNQLSHWISQVDENLQIDMNLNGLTADALNTFQMRISYSLLNNRIRITRSGGFTSVNNQANATAVIGDWTVEYMISKDGKFRLKAYYKSITNTFNLGQNNIGASGMGLSYTHSFNNFGDLLPRFRKAKKQSKDKKNIIIPDDEIR